MQHLKRLNFILVLLFLLGGRAAAATDTTTLTSDINSLISQGNQLVVDMDAMTLTAVNMGSGLSTLETSVSVFTSSVLNVYSTLDGSSGLMLSEELLVSLQTLSTTSMAVANGLLQLSNAITVTAPMTMLTTLDSSLASMLRLSDDIGTMANRIGEMADRILIMSDNIGDMADRILATQIIQGNNVALVVDAIMQTQKNVLSLIVMFNL